jgi:flagellar hook-length control protein FliK
VAALPERIVAQVQRAKDGDHTAHRLTVRLDPPDLGSVSLHFELRDGAVSVLLRPERSEATALLTGQRERVADALQREGLNLAGFDVRTDAGGAGTGARDGSGDGRPGGRSGRGAAAIDLDRTNTTDVPLTLERELRL